MRLITLESVPPHIDDITHWPQDSRNQGANGYIPEKRRTEETKADFLLNIRHGQGTIGQHQPNLIEPEIAILVSA